MGTHYDLGVCLDCGARRRVRHREWGHASKPRCRKCGGTLVPSATAVAEHIERDQLGRERMRVRVRGGRVIT